MFRKRFLSLLLVFAAALPRAGRAVDAPAKTEPRKTEEKELYDDGTLHFRVSLNLKGERNGQFTAYFRGGKKIQERVRYERGQRVGTRELFDESGALIAEETWIQGKLICPKSQRQIEAARARILKAAAAGFLKMGKVSNPRAPSPDELARSVAQLNAYRFLCDLPSDVTLDDSYINLCQYASEVLQRLGHLTHTPEHPAGLDDKSYELGKDGCGHSNIFQGGDAIASVDAYMFDSDQSNIDRLGHRRWILNPSMGKTGFGMSGLFSAMYSLDGSRKDAPDYDFVCYPPRGWCPLNMFNADAAWHVSLNPGKYKVGDEAELAIFLVDSRLERSKQPLAIEYKHIDRNGFGINNAIIARPARAAIRPGAVYEVAVHGVQLADGSAADLSYYVSFYGASAGRR